MIYFSAEVEMDTLIITGWGWKEYAVAAAIALRAVKGQAEVMGMSKRRLPEFLEGCGRKWKRKRERKKYGGCRLWNGQTRMVPTL